MRSEVRVFFRPAGRSVQVAEGVTIASAANQAGVALEQVCGGKGTCGKCKVRLLSGSLGPLSDAERRLLSPDEVAAGMRLACQAAVREDCAVEVAWAAVAGSVSILVDGVAEPVPLDPPVRKDVVRLPTPTLQEPVAAYSALRLALPGAEGLAPGIEALRALPAALQAGGGLVTAVRWGNRLLAVEPGDSGRALLGFACDIGTTTVVGYLLDLHTGERLAVASTLNPQTRFGDDVVSRVEMAQRDEGGREALRAAIVAAIDELIGQAAAQAGLAREEVYALAVVGNTAMHHLFLGLNPASLGHSPYVPVVADPLELSAQEVGLHAHPAARLLVLPNIAGYVGADTVGVLLATRLLESDQVRLAVDIGTNGEMALGSRARILACSTAAGPAFEGAQLSHGMRAADGAIDHLDLRGDELVVHSIGRGKLRGICGSGAVDAIAVLRHLEIIDATGRLLAPDEVASRAGRRLAHRLVPHAQGGAFVLAPAEETATGAPVLLTQRDIRQIQLAKGAIRAGIEILMKELGVAPDQVEGVALAGAFGNYIRPESALAIGLLPRFPKAEVSPVGNAAGAGAQMALLSRQAWRDAAAIAARVEYVELSLRQDFAQVFMEAMLL